MIRNILTMARLSHTYHSTSRKLAEACFCETGDDLWIKNSTLAHWCIKPKPSVASEIARILFFPQNLPVKGIWVRSVRFSAGWVGGDPYSFSMLFGICLLSHLGCAGVPKHRKWRHLFWDSAWKIMSFNHSMRCWIICGVKVGGLNSKRWSVQNPIYCETSKALCHLLWNDVKRL